jgi:cold shock protein
MQEGTVKFFNETKGFGFITPNNGGQDIFVHITGLTPGLTLNEKDRVVFEIQDGRKGPNAVNVRMA